MVGSGQTPPSLLLVASLIVRIDIVMMAVGWLALMVSQPPHLHGLDVGLFADLDGDASVNFALILNNIEETKVQSVKGSQRMPPDGMLQPNQCKQVFSSVSICGSFGREGGRREVNLV